MSKRVNYLDVLLLMGVDEVGGLRAEGGDFAGMAKESVNQDGDCLILAIQMLGHENITNGFLLYQSVIKHFNNLSEKRKIPIIVSSRGDLGRKAILYHHNLNKPIILKIRNYKISIKGE